MRCAIHHSLQSHILLPSHSVTVSPIHALLPATPLHLAATSRHGCHRHGEEAAGGQCPARIAVYGFRYYAPEIGRWVSRDPIGERGLKVIASFEDHITNETNRYVLLHNLPTGSVDALGLRGYSPCSQAQIDSGCRPVSRYECGYNSLWDCMNQEYGSPPGVSAVCGVVDMFAGAIVGSSLFPGPGTAGGVISGESVGAAVGGLLGGGFPSFNHCTESVCCCNGVEGPKQPYD